MGNIIDILEKLKTETEIDPRGASDTLKKVLNYSEKIINNNILMKKYYVLSFYYWNIGDRENAKKYIDKSFSIIEYVSDSNLIIEVYIMAGNVEFLTQNSTLAFKLYLNALKLSTDKTPSSIYGRIYNNIASIFIDYGDLVRAEEFLNKALYIIDESDIYLLQIICSNIIEINIKNKNFNKTEKFLEMLERTFNIYDSIKIKNSYYLYKFLIEVNHGNYEEGFIYYEMGKKSFDYLGFKSGFINFYILSFKPLVMIGKDDLAIENLEFAKEYCKSSNLYLSLRKILKELIEYYLDREKRKSAVNFYLNTTGWTKNRNQRGLKI